MTATIYKIENKINGKSYIGSTIRFKRRILDHWSSLSKGIHHSAVLQRAYLKYGKIAFDVYVVEQFDFVSKEHLLEREQFYLDTLKPVYNICKTAGSQLGSKRNKAFKDKCSDRMKGNVAWNKGKKTGPQSDIVLQKRSNAMKGKTCHADTKDKIIEKISKPVSQYDASGAFIKSWKSAKEISESFGCSYTGLIAYLSGKSNIPTYRGFIWRRTIHPMV